MKKFFHNFGLIALVLGVFVGSAVTLSSHAASNKKAAPKKAAGYADIAKVTGLMKFEDVARLEYSQRVKYVRMLRAAAADIEKMQYIFRDKNIFETGLNSPMIDRNEFYAVIFGQVAEAQQEKEQIFADRMAGYDCIYAYQLSKYEGKPGQRVHFGCKNPAPCDVAGSKEKGVQCDYFLSGLSANHPRSCIPRDTRYKATMLCDKVREDLSKENRSSIKDLIKNVDAHFKFTSNPDLKSDEKMSKELLESPKSVNLLKELALRMYDDEVYAEMIKLLMEYKLAGIDPIPLKGVQFKNPADEAAFKAIWDSIKSPSKFEERFNTFSNTVENIFGAHVNHCQSPIAKEALDDIRRPNYLAQQKAKGPGPGILAKRQKDAVTILDGGGMVKDKDGNTLTQDELNCTDRYCNNTVLEIDECHTIAVMRNKLLKRARDIYGSLPNNPPPLPQPDQPEPPQDPNDSKISPTGCSKIVSGEAEHLSQAAPRCAVCMAERAMFKSRSKGMTAAEAKKKIGYAASTKWMSLLSTMAAACNDINRAARKTEVTFDTMMRYMHMFGHCSANTYDWDRGPALNDTDKEIIREWQSTNAWAEINHNRKLKDISPDINSDFKRIYGMDYESATDAFCNPAQFKKEGGKYKMLNESYRRPAESQDSQVRRDRFDSFVSSMKRESIDNDLANCMAESRATMKELYADNGGPQCSKSVSAGSLTNGDAMNAVFNEIDTGGTVVLYSGTDCYVARQVEGRGKGYAERNIAFARVNLWDPQTDQMPADYRAKLRAVPDREKGQVTPEIIFCEGSNDDACLGKPAKLNNLAGWTYTLTSANQCWSTYKPATDGRSRNTEK